jgi:hypothetical protein
MNQSTYFHSSNASVVRLNSTIIARHVADNKRQQQINSQSSRFIAGIFFEIEKKETSS